MVKRIIARALELVDESHPLLPGVEHALQLCREQGFRIGLASASPLFMLQHVLHTFGLTYYFDTLASAESLPFSRPHPQVYLKAARMRSIMVLSNAHAQDPRWVMADKKLNSLQVLTLEDLTGN